MCRRVQYFFHIEGDVTFTEIAGMHRLEATFQIHLFQPGVMGGGAQRDRRGMQLIDQDFLL